MITVEEISKNGYPNDNDVQPNVPLIRKVVEWAIAEDERQKDATDWSSFETTWDQDWWHSDILDRKGQVCGTSYCIAGYVGQMLDERYRHQYDVDGVHVSSFARVNLGLTDRQANRLFNGSNNINDVRAVAFEIIGEKM